jgi:hypothetical protein
MQHVLNDIHELDHVLGYLLIGADGNPACVQASSGLEIPSGGFDWMPFVEALEQIREAEFLFDDMRLYVRKTSIGYLLVVMEIYAVPSLVKLQCDVLTSKIGSPKAKGLKRFFKK